MNEFIVTAAEASTLALRALGNDPSVDLRIFNSYTNVDLSDIISFLNLRIEIAASKGKMKLEIYNVPREVYSPLEEALKKAGFMVITRDSEDMVVLWSCITDRTGGGV